MNYLPEDIVKAHQYLYYVLGEPVWPDYEYDIYCHGHGISGIGGSDCVSDYPANIIALAKLIALIPGSFPSK